MNRNVFIDNIELNNAKKSYIEALNFKAKFEEISVYDSLGRITKTAVYAKLSSPYYNAAAMDGIAVMHEKTVGASEVNPIKLKENIDFIYVNTGNVIKQPFTAVIMIEDVTTLKDGNISIIRAAHPWQHVRPIGEDIVTNEMILPSNHKIRGIDLGALLSGGIDKVSVYKKLKVGIIPTGSEIISNINDITTGKIIDSNSLMFEGLIKESGGNPVRYNPTEDNYIELKKILVKALKENDLIIINAGSSAGTKDFTVSLIKELGEVIVHGIAIKPGKPTILGIIDKKPVIGIPGYPVSAYISFDNFVKPLIRTYGGQKEDDKEKIEVTMAKRVVSSFKHLEKVRITIGFLNNKYIAVPLSRGAGTTMSLVKADGIISIAKNCEGIEAGELVEAELLKPISEIKGTLVSIGSHDIIMDLLSDKMPLSSSHVGSMGGLLALRRGECHLAPIHLMDKNTGEYNTSYIKQYFPGKKMILIKGVQRAQGFIVKKGNPKNIKTFKDLIRKDVEYVNRQNGAGTRILLDYHLNKNQIKYDMVEGYERIVPTHMSVAIAIQSDSADTGLGIEAAAKALDLDFVHITYEDYDFLINESELKNNSIKKMLSLLVSDDFRNKIKELGGYSTENSGTIYEIQG